MTEVNFITQGCGCRYANVVPSSSDFPGLGLTFCPMHKAAPDLLAALEALDNNENIAIPGLEWELVRAAIAKARGQ